MLLSKKILNLSPSPTLALDAKAKALTKQGKKVINLTIGEPDFATPNNICHAAIEAIEQGFTHYTPSAGILDLRIAIADKLKKENNLIYDPNTEIVVGVGTKQILYSLFLTICNPDDEIIVFAPVWSTYIEQIKLAGGKPIVINLKPPFDISANILRKYISTKTKAIVINSPCNPTGRMISESELKKIADIAVKNKILVISDEIYEHIIYNKKHTSIASLGEEIKELTITVNGFSKSYAMTGWRIGYAAGPKNIIKGMVDIASQTTSGTSSISQYAALEAYKGSNKSMKNMSAQFAKRKNYLVKQLNKVNYLDYIEPDGAFYIFLDLRKILSKQHITSSQWCEKLLENKGVAIVSGEAFCMPGYARISFATNLQNIRNGINRIQQFVQLSK
ncbi:MAG: pyridoxal phosphate-dependent aminotransferase [Patescibacteria group bacterium]